MTLVTSPNTEHHSGKATRRTSLEPVLRGIMKEVFELMNADTIHMMAESMVEASRGPAAR